MGLKPGEKVEFRTNGRVITILPQEELDDDEYTPAQRKVIDAEIAEGLAQIERGDCISFNSAAELAAWVEAGIAKKKRMRKKRK